MAYGDWWNGPNCGMEWYNLAYSKRSVDHAVFWSWLQRLQLEVGEFGSALEVGGGPHLDTARLFAERRFVGVDVCAWAMQSCAENTPASQDHEFIAAEIEDLELEEQFDLVVSHAVVDHVVDVDRFIRALVARSRGVVYVASYRGWYPDLEDHEYHWDPGFECSFNKVAAKRLRALALELGMEIVSLVPHPTQNGRTETILVLRRPEFDAAADKVEVVVTKSL